MLLLSAKRPQILRQGAEANVFKGIILFNMERINLRAEIVEGGAVRAIGLCKQRRNKIV